MQLHPLLLLLLLLLLLPLQWLQRLKTNCLQMSTMMRSCQYRKQSRRQQQRKTMPTAEMVPGRLL